MIFGAAAPQRSGFSRNVCEQPRMPDCSPWCVLRGFGAFISGSPRDVNLGVIQMISTVLPEIDARRSSEGSPSADRSI